MITAMRLAQIALHADDLDRAEAFYTTLLGAGPSGRFEPPGLLFYDLHGTRLLLEGAGPKGIIYLEVDDVAAQLDALREVATVLSEPHLIFTHEDDALGPTGTQEWQAFVTDSEGNTVGLVELRPV
jgi:methylmalonyl-CoA/ethylmalonyl-CoA epimerase